MESTDLNVVDAEIARRERELATLKVHRNTLAPINRKLPPEILSQIFIHRRNLSCRWQPYDWITLTHICHYWRELSQHTHSLWSYLRVRSTGIPVDQIVQMSTRSHQAPLAVEVYFDHHRLGICLDMIKALSGDMHRAEHLHFWAAESSFVATTDCAFALLTSRAQELRLKSLFVWGQNRFWAPTWAQLNGLFSPLMQHLCLRLETFPAELWSTLRTMPLLAELELHFPHRGSDESLASGSLRQPAIPLDRLDEIHLHGPPSICTSLLESLVFPSTTSMTVFSGSKISTKSRLRLYAALIDALIYKLETPGDCSVRRPLSSLYVQRSKIPGCMVVDAWSTTHTSQVLRDGPQGRRFHVVLPVIVATRFGVALGKLYQDVRSLFINNIAEFTPLGHLTDEWAAIVGKMSNLRELMVAGYTCVILPQVLGFMTKDKGDNMDDAEILQHIYTNPTLPHLQTLTVDCPYHATSRWRALSIRLLQRIFRARKLLGTGPTSINFIDDSEDAVNVLRSLNWNDKLYGRLTLLLEPSRDLPRLPEFSWDTYCDSGEPADSSSDSDDDTTDDGSTDDPDDATDGGTEGESDIGDD